MVYSDNRVLRDKDGYPIPQLYDPVRDTFDPATDELDAEQLEELKSLKKKQQEVSDRIQSLVNKQGSVDNFPNDYPDSAALTELQNIKQKQTEIDGRIQTLVKNQGDTSVSNFPDDYPDSAALNELQTLKSDVAETKKTQADILSKLNGTLDTRLTGSNVGKEIILESDVNHKDFERTYGKRIILENGNTSAFADKNDAFDVSKYKNLTLSIENNFSVEMIGVLRMGDKKDLRDDRLHHFGKETTINLPAGSSTNIDSDDNNLLSNNYLYMTLEIKINNNNYPKKENIYVLIGGELIG